jgi:hypothetical protein
LTPPFTLPLHRTRNLVDRGKQAAPSRQWQCRNWRFLSALLGHTMLNILHVIPGSFTNPYPSFSFLSTPLLLSRLPPSSATRRSNHAARIMCRSGITKFYSYIDTVSVSLEYLHTTL